MKMERVTLGLCYLDLGLLFVLDAVTDVVSLVLAITVTFAAAATGDSFWRTLGFAAALLLAVRLSRSSTAFHRGYMLDAVRDAPHPRHGDSSADARATIFTKREIVPLPTCVLCALCCIGAAGLGVNEETNTIRRLTAAALVVVGGVFIEVLLRTALVYLPATGAVNFVVTVLTLNNSADGTAVTNDSSGNAVVVEHLPMTITVLVGGGDDVTSSRARHRPRHAARHN